LGRVKGLRITGLGFQPFWFWKKKKMTKKDRVGKKKNVKGGMGEIKIGSGNHCPEGLPGKSQRGAVGGKGKKERGRKLKIQDLSRDRRQKKM